MIEVQEKGVFNLTNPGTTEHDWILKKYAEFINPQHSWKLVSYEEQMKHIKSDRSNNELCTKKLEGFCNKHNIELLSIQESITRCLIRRLRGDQGVLNHSQN
jgi:hypothetical protein